MQTRWERARNVAPYLVGLSLCLGVPTGVQAQAARRPLQWGAALQYRFEFRDNFDWDRTRDDRDGFHLLRTRFQVTWTVAAPLQVFLQVQDARLWGLHVTDRSPFQNPLDVHQAYLDIRWGPKEAVIFRIGRQKLSYGDERLLGGFEWSNVAQAFDAARLMTRAGAWSLHAFVGRRVVPRPDRLDRWDRQDTLGGLYTTWTRPPMNLDLYLLYRHTTRPVVFHSRMEPGTLREPTLGFRVRWPRAPGRVDATVEGAFQTGRYGRQDIRAFAWAAVGGYTWDVWGRPRAGLEVDWASGDRDPGDGVRETFDNLFPTNHPHYGYMDFLGWQNMWDVRLTASLNPHPRWSVEANLHRMGLHRTTDALYNAARRAVRLAAGPVEASTVGSEVDILIRWTPSARGQALLGYSRFWPGAYLRQTGPADPGTFIYVQLNVALP